MDLICFRFLKLRYLFLLFIFFCFLFNSFSQNNKPSTETHKKATIQTIDGTKYYVHTVEKGQTLYIISKIYDRSLSDIIMDNPKAIDGIQPGSILKISVEKPNQKISTSVAPDSNKYVLHKVEKGQTLYSISKKYNVTVDQLIALNPELKLGPKNGQVIKISEKSQKLHQLVSVALAKAAEKRPATDIDTVKKIETKNTHHPVKIESKELLSDKQLYEGELKDEYNVAFFLPFHTKDAEGIEVEKIIRDEDQFSNKTNIALQFYEGALLAIDSLKKEKLNAKIFVYDIDDSDSLNSVEILKKPELAEMDLIIGPLYSSSFMPVAKFAKEHSIPIVSPFIQLNKILFDNPYVCKVTSSNFLQIVQMANFVVDTFHTQNIILVNNGGKKEMDMNTIFTATARETATKKVYPIGDSIKVAKDFNSIKPLLHPTKQNVIVLLSNNQSYVTEFLNSINVLQENKKIVVFGLQSWMNFDNLDFDYLNSLSLHIVSNNYIDYKNPVTKAYHLCNQR